MLVVQDFYTQSHRFWANGIDFCTLHHEASEAAQPYKVWMESPAARGTHLGVGVSEHGRAHEA